MTRLNILKNRRLLTFVLLGVTLLFGGVAVFLAIAINNRNVNPDDTNAASYGCYVNPNDPSDNNNGDICGKDCNGDGSWDVSGTCSGGSCSGAGSCSDVGGSKIKCRTQSGVTPADAGSSEQCGGDGKGSVEIWADSCNPERGAEARNFKCDTPLGGGGGDTPTKLTRCNVYPVSYPENGCANSSQTKYNAQDCLKCPSSPLGTDGSGCIEAVGTCGGGDPVFDPNAVTPTPADTTGWKYPNAACRYVTGGGKCAKADFNSSCNPGVGQMCFCNGGTLLGKDDKYTYYSGITTGGLTCGASCDTPETASGGIFTAPECNNPYRCAADITPTPTNVIPTPTCISTCDSSVNQRIVSCKYPSDSSYTEVSRTPENCGGGNTCTPTVKCEGTDLVTRNCSGTETGRQENYPPCLGGTGTPPPIPVAVACYDMKVTRNGTALADNATVNPGDVLTLSISSSGTSIGNRFSYDDGTGTTRVISGEGTFNDHINPNTVTFTVPTNATPGAQIRVIGGGLYKFSEPGKLTSTCANNDCANDGQNVVWCGTTVDPYKRDLTNTAAIGAINPTTGAVTSVQGLYTGVAKSTIESQLQFSCSSSALCQKRFVVSNTPPSACTNLTVTNTRTNQSCNGADKAACANIGVRQGDTLTATVTGTGATGYSMSASYVTEANTTSTSSFNTQASNSFSITIPSTTEIKSANLVANTTNGVSTVTSASCNLPFTFSSTPQIDKEINTANSVNLGAGNVVTSASEVEYDITVSNTGTAIKNNVIVVDRLSAFDPANGGAAVNPAFGDIIQATDLSRTTGTLSTPSPVAPRAIFDASGTQIGSTNPGNTYTTGQAVKTVEWNRITALHPTEAYTGKVRVDIGSFTNNPTLRNTVCLYNDTNNNGQYDTGTDTQIACDSVDVYTQTPTFTVEKTADVGTIEVGNPITYTIKVTNTSGSGLDLSNLTVTDTIDPDKIDSLSITDISNGGTLANNVITWSSANLISANGGSTLAADGTIDLTFNATPDETIFTSASECSTQMINNVEADSTTPDYTTTGSTVTVTVTRVCITATPNPSGTLPPTGTDTPLYLPIIGIGLVAAAGTVFIFQKKILRRGGKNLQKTMSSETPEQKLRSKIRMRKK